MGNHVNIFIIYPILPTEDSDSPYIYPLYLVFVDSFLYIKKKEEKKKTYLKAPFSPDKPKA